MIAATKKALILALGWSFIFLGIIGLFLPFLQGILFMIIGLTLLSRESAIARNLMERLEKKHPRPFQIAREWRGRFSDRFHRWSGR